MRLELTTLGAWRVHGIVAEYDAQDDVIRIDRDALASVERCGGRETARAFLRYALAHELAHRADPRRSEVEVHALAQGATGLCARQFSEMLRR